jgi:hypothetical protein
MTKDEALKLALEAFNDLAAWNDGEVGSHMDEPYAAEVARRIITAIEEALAQSEQEPVAYDKTEMNCFVQDLYDKKMQEGKHGHYETMFHVVHQAIKKVPPQRTWVGLTDREIDELWMSHHDDFGNPLSATGYERAIEAKLKEKNT